MVFKITFKLIDDVLAERHFTEQEIIHSKHQSWVDNCLLSVSEDDRPMCRFRISIH